MRRVSRSLPWILAAACGACTGDYWLGGKRPTQGASARIDAGANALVWDADVVLSGDDSLDLPPEGAGACRIIAGGHVIRSEGAWRGHLGIRGCSIAGLGSASKEAISLEVSGSGSVTIEDVTFGSSGAVRIGNAGDSTTTFRNNVILADSTVPVDASADVTTPAFSAEGAGTAPKVFQGNRIHRSGAWFQSPNWLIGGDTDAESNVIVGLRGSIGVGATGIVVRGNYVHSLHLTDSGDEAPMTASYGILDTLTEHNVLRGGTWVFRGIGGEIRYNAVLDVEVAAWLYQPFENTRVHHNLFLMCHPPREEVQGGIFLVNKRMIGIEVYNNTLDAGGTVMRHAGAAIVVDDLSFLASLRSNAIFGFPYYRNDGGAGAVRPGILEGVSPPPPRVGYADYNLFYNPDAKTQRNYAVAVPGHTVRVDPGFGRNDAQAGGPLDEQVDPGLVAITGGCFPWSDDDITTSKVTVSQMLRTLRSGYTPPPGSPLRDAGDPRDGAGTPIGAIGDGTSSSDLFGTFGL